MTKQCKTRHNKLLHKLLSHTNISVISDHWKNICRRRSRIRSWWKWSIRCHYCIWTSVGVGMVIAQFGSKIAFGWITMVYNYFMVPVRVHYKLWFNLPSYYEFNTSCNLVSWISIWMLYYSWILISVTGIYSTVYKTISEDKAWPMYLWIGRYWLDWVNFVVLLNTK